MTTKEKEQDKTEGIKRKEQGKGKVKEICTEKFSRNIRKTE